MNGEHQPYSYTWHQSHDQATVLILVPYETLPDDVLVVIEQNFLVAGVCGQPPVVKGRLYGNVDTATSVWQLEPRASTRERTTSTTSTISTQSSFAFVSDPEISSSFAASLESGHVSENDEPTTTSPRTSSPPPRNERTAMQHAVLSHPTSPRTVPFVMSSFSSVESLHSDQSGRLLTLHIEKGDQVIWPSLIVGPVPELLSPLVLRSPGVDTDDEQKYNMDPTSLGLIAEELLDIRKDKEEAFECFMRAWHQGHSSLSTLRLVSHYLPLHITAQFKSPSPGSAHGSPEYYMERLGDSAVLAQLYLEAGLLYLEGAADVLMSPSYSALSSIRTTEPRSFTSDNGVEAWRRDRDSARRYLDRARFLCPQLNVPLLPPDGEDFSPLHLRSGPGSGSEHLKMPSVDIQPVLTAIAGSKVSPSQGEPETTLRPRRRPKEDKATSMVKQAEANDGGDDNTWYLYLPGLVGAGTALLVVGVISALSFSSWRKNQN